MTKLDTESIFSAFSWHTGRTSGFRSRYSLNHHLHPKVPGLQVFLFTHYQSVSLYNFLAFNKIFWQKNIWPQQHFQTKHTWQFVADRGSDVTFLSEALSTVLTDVRFFPCVELHVVPQRAEVSQQLGAECALHLGEKSKIKHSMSFLPSF